MYNNRSLFHYFLHLLIQKIVTITLNPKIHSFATKYFSLPKKNIFASEQLNRSINIIPRYNTCITERVNHQLDHNKSWQCGDTRNPNESYYPGISGANSMAKEARLRRKRRRKKGGGEAAKR